MKTGFAVLLAITCGATTAAGSAAKTRVAVVDLERCVRETEDALRARAALVKAPPSLTWTLQGTPPAHPVLLAIWYQRQLAALQAEKVARAKLEQATFEPIRAKARVVLAEVATKKGLDLVVDRSSVDVPSDAVDITDDVIRAYDWSTP